MWVITPRGFFSVVEKFSDRDDGMVTIRTRNRADIDKLADLLPDAKPFQEKFLTDYAWRIRVPKTDWAIALAKMAMEIEYTNFKDEVKRVQGPKRSEVYHALWFDLLQLEDGTKKKTTSYGGGGYWTDEDEQAWADGTWGDERDDDLSEDDSKDEPAPLKQLPLTTTGTSTKPSAKPKPKPKVQPKAGTGTQASKRASRSNQRANTRAKGRNQSTTKRQPSRQRGRKAA